MSSLLWMDHKDPRRVLLQLIIIFFRFWLQELQTRKNLQVEKHTATVLRLFFDQTAWTWETVSPVNQATKLLTKARKVV